MQFVFAAEEDYMWENELCSYEYTQFINELNSNENTIEVSQKAIEHIAYCLQIGKVEIRIDVPQNVYTPQGEHKSILLYMDSEHLVNEDVIVEKKHISGEKGVIVATAKPWLIANSNPQRDKNIEFLLETLIVYMCRTRILNQIKTAAITDRGTGIPNTDGLLEIGNRLIEMGRIDSYAAVYLNIKSFKLINKMIGYGNGNKLIVKYISKIQENLTHDEYIARLGGDYFVALIKQENIEDFLRYVREIRIVIEEYDEKIPIKVNAVCGIYCIDKPEIDMGTIMNAITTAYNYAKHVTRKKYEYYSSEIGRKNLFEKEIVTVFRSALLDNEFLVYYQPKVNIDNLDLVGGEALVRWQKNNKILAPGHFIPTLEKDNSICILDYYVLEKVCQDINKWEKEGIEPVRISVNFSRRHLTNPNFSKIVLNIIDSYHIDHHYIEIEITESVDVIEQENLKKFVKHMKSQEVRTSIDDFGVGYSSMNLLRFIPVDILKIDKSFIDSDKLKERDKIIFDNIVNMAKDLEIEIITEGVEEWEQIEFLKDVGCHFVQGYIFDKPLPIEEFEEKMLMKNYKKVVS